MKDAARHRTLKNPKHLRGEDNSHAKLSAEAVRCIRAEPDSPDVLKMLALAFDVQPRSIRRVRARQLWAHVEDAL